MSNENNRAREALTSLEQELRLLVDTIPTLVWTAGSGGDIEYVNKRVLEYLGATLDEIIGNGWVEKVHPDDVAFKTRTWLANLESRTAHEAVCRFRGADGQYRWFAVSGAPLKAGDGRVLRWCGVMIDIDDRRKAEEAIRESEGKLRDYAETASDWFWEIGPDYKFTLLTENAFGSGPADRIGTACWDRALDLETEPEKWRFVRATLDSRKPFRDFVYRGLGGNGYPMYVKASGKPVFDANGEFRGYRGTGTDVTALMRAQEEHERLRQLESDLAHMNRLSMMGELAASLSHEITQPISSARNNARAAQNFLDMQPPDL